MAKNGFPYYASDTDRFQDIRIKRLKKAFGCVGYSVYEYILNEIYRVQGCCIEWGSDTAFDVAEYWGIKESTVDEVVNYCAVVGLFDKELLDCERVISSSSILRRYQEMCSKTKRKPVTLPWIFKPPEESPKTPEESPKTPEESPKTPEVFRHSKVKESKVKENKTNTPLPLKGAECVCLLPFDEDSPVMVRVREKIPDADVCEAFRKFVAHRHSSGHTISEFSIDGHIKRLLEISKDPKFQADALAATVDYDWKSINPRPDGKPKTQTANRPVESIPDDGIDYAQLIKNSQNRKGYE